MIKAANLSRLRMMDFFMVVSNIKDYSEKEDLEALKLKDVFDQKYIPAFETFDLSLTPARQKELTDSIHRLDKKRDTYFVGLNAHLRALRNFPDKEVAEASIRLRNTIDSFGKKIHSLPLAEETAVLINILQELDLPNLKKDVAITGVVKWVDEIRKLNESLRTSFKERINKEASVEVGKSKVARDAMQKVFTEFCNRINALALLDDIAPYRTLIDNINREIDRVKQINKQRSNSTKSISSIETPSESE